MIIDGRTLAQEVLARAKARAAKLPHPPRVLALVANETAATKSYLSIKAKRAADAGCMLEVRQFPESVSTEELKAAIQKSDADAIIAQLPLPEGVDTKVVCDAIPIEKDADVLSDAARQTFARGDMSACIPPVVGAIAEICHTQSLEPRGKNAVVIGRGFLVGAPAALWLAQQGAHVTVLTRASGDFVTVLGAADIIVSGAGSPHLITPEMLKEGVVLIDAGTSESGGAVVGDADPACAEHCSLFTPVPGGIGPLAVACLFENVVALVERTTYP
jgi:methylenetetrahydrofolate dehydrogenase (NADP+)/methenyltetrahydrofolate cyclohydrolase